MTNTLTYKGYLGSIEHDLKDRVLFGQVLFLADSVYYQGETLSELQKCFEDAVEEYIATCAEIGKDPEKPFNGSFNIRMNPALHKQLSYRSAEEGCTLNALVVKACDKFILDEAQSRVVHNHHHNHYSINFDYPVAQDFFMSTGTGKSGSYSKPTTQLRVVSK